MVLWKCQQDMVNPWRYKAINKNKAKPQMPKHLSQTLFILDSFSLVSYAADRKQPPLCFNNISIRASNPGPGLFWAVPGSGSIRLGSQLWVTRLLRWEKPFACSSHLQPTLRKHQWIRSPVSARQRAGRDWAQIKRATAASRWNPCSWSSPLMTTSDSCRMWSKSRGSHVQTKQKEKEDHSRPR